MSTSILVKETRLHLLFMLYVMVFMGLFLQMIIRPAENVRFEIQDELSSMNNYLTTTDFTHLEQRTHTRFQSWMYDSGFYPFIDNALRPEEQKQYATEWQEKASFNLISDANLLRFLENLQLFSFQIVHRITLMEFWLIALFPMCIAITATGYYHWQMKQYQLAGSSVNHVRGYMKLIWLTLFVLCVYLITPNVFGAYTIFAPAVLLLTIATATSLILSNFSK